LKEGKVPKLTTPEKPLDFDYGALDSTFQLMPLTLVRQFYYDSNGRATGVICDAVKIFTYQAHPLFVSIDASYEDIITPHFNHRLATYTVSG